MQSYAIREIKLDDLAFLEKTFINKTCDEKSYIYNYIIVQG